MSSLQKCKSAKLESNHNTEKITKNIEINLVVSKIIRTFAAVLRHNDFCGKAKEKSQREKFCRPTRKNLLARPQKHASRNRF